MIIGFKLSQEVFFSFFTVKKLSEIKTNSTPEKFNIRRGDIVKPVPIMDGKEPSYLLKRFDWAVNFDYPEGYHIVLTNPDEEGEIIVESLLTGKRRCDSTKAWIKIGYAGINILEGEEEN